MNTHVDRGDATEWHAGVPEVVRDRQVKLNRLVVTASSNKRPGDVK